MEESKPGEFAVVLVNGTGSGEFAAVRDILRDSLETPVVLLEKAPVSYDMDSGLLDAGGRLVRPAVVWTRHTGALTLAVHTSLAPVAAAAWSSLATQLAAAAPVALPGPAPRGTAQLLDARRIGVPVPRTVLATDASAAVERLRAARTVVKTPDFRLADADRDNWGRYVPVVVDAAGPSAGDAPAHVVVVQEYVGHVQELRVFHLDGGLCTFRVRKPGIAAPWTAPDTVSVTAVRCPAPAADAVRRLCARWGLRYGAFDLLVRPDGEVVFLEANPDGDWLWYERRAGTPGRVSFMAAVMVRALFARTAWKGARDDD
ncbi:hypothetical protein [Actinoplanes sp. NPDC020271]|uniref:hypothetical protein n=1 Tax=Actinoplanes sp. NPDC020271 TaxID=3363896 RepID=UPI0037AECA0D